MRKFLCVVACMCCVSIGAFADINEDLFSAIKKKSLTDVTTAIEQGADVNSTNDKGDTVLMTALKKKNLDIIKYLIEKSADVNSTDDKGNTVLMAAAAPGWIDVVKVLVEDGNANVNLQNNDGYTALDFAQGNAMFNNVGAVIKYLQEHGAKTGEEIKRVGTGNSGNDAKARKQDDKENTDGDIKQPDVDTRSDADKKLQELKDNAQKMKDKEQSSANKLLGGAAIGAVGIGGMNIASALSEKSADSDAEEDMRAYLATFSCDYGVGRNITGGEVGIELPGANDLTPLVSEYRALAADIAQRKAALGMSPGIEAEVVFDKSETGLYDNVAAGTRPGAFTSLSRALQDENSDDAKAWAAQKDATSQKLKTGAIVAGIGVVGSIAGNMIINNKNKNKSDELLAEYQILKKLESDINNLPKDDKVCQCKQNQICNENTTTCENCLGNKVALDNKCVCPEPLTEQSNDMCVQKDESVQWSCSPDSAKHIVADDIKAGTCRCVDGYIPDNAARPTSCTCPSDTHEEKVQGNTVQCIEKSVTQNPDVIIPQTVNLGTSQLFGTGLYTIQPAAGAKISEFAGSVKAQNKDKYCIKIVGNTDRTGSDKVNIPLSKNRAIAVAKYLVDVNGLSVAHVCATGLASINCAQDGDQPSCRNVQMSYSSGSNCASDGCLPLNYVE